MEFPSYLVIYIYIYDIYVWYTVGTTKISIIGARWHTLKKIVDTWLIPEGNFGIGPLRDTESHCAAPITG